MRPGVYLLASVRTSPSCMLHRFFLARRQSGPGRRVGLALTYIQLTRCVLPHAFSTCKRAFAGDAYRYRRHSRLLTSGGPICVTLCPLWSCLLLVLVTG